jgi:outer membrane protein
MMKQLLIFSCLGLCLPISAEAKPYKLEEILDMARKGNPGLVAGTKATAGVEALLLEARRSWMPSGELSSILAPTMSIRCMSETDTEVNPDRSVRENNCVRTNFTYNKGSWADAVTNISGVFSRTEIKLVQPVYTFGKISAGVAAAESGVKASQNRQFGLVADLELNVRKAYWGAKLAREILTTLTEGTSYLDEAQKKIEKDLAEGSGDTSVTDRLRLRTMRSEIEARILEAKRMAEIARGGLRALIGPDAPADLDADEAPLEAIATTPHTLDDYKDAAKQSRPEIKALEHLAAAKRALADFEWRKQYPDLVLIGTAQYAYANAIDTPKNAFANNPFNTTGAGIAAAIRMPLDLGIKNAHAMRSRAEAEEAEQKRREASSGILFEVEKAHLELKEAEERMKVVQKGEKAGRQWIAAIAQNLAVGLSETKDFSDALLAYFQARIRYLQSMYDYNVAAAALTRATGIDVYQTVQ